ncbi:MAG: ABC transporter ATP-binding protein [Deltaproteobacteria bacterium]|nr:ABC transporter ATP-binding protein [Deltaproteobacteria bacterium]
MGVILECLNLGFRYGKSVILKDVSFTVEAGLFYAILGKNGSGKTTLLHCLNGILKPDTGRVELDRQNLVLLSRQQIARRISLVPQEHLEIFPFTVLDVVVMGRAPFLKMTQAPAPEDYQLARDALRMLDAENLAAASFNRISGGERQLALLAAALVQASRIMLLDEPTNHLDFNNQFRLLAQVKELCRSRQLSVVATMHDPNMARLYADRVIMVGEGRIVAQGPTAEVMTTANIDTLYQTRTFEICGPGNKKLFLPQAATAGTDIDH